MGYNETTPIERCTMLTKMNIAIAMLAVDNMYKSRYILKLIKRYREVQNLNATYEEDIKYLVDMLNRNDIKLDEFDMIALTHVTGKSS